jgi:hypothetical protein
MNLRVHKTVFRTIRPGDPDWHLRDGLIVTPRAGFEITSGCPIEYKRVIQECIRQSWLKPVAQVRDEDLVWERLCD